MGSSTEAEDDSILSDDLNLRNISPPIVIVSRKSSYSKNLRCPRSGNSLRSNEFHHVRKSSKRSTSSNSLEWEDLLGATLTNRRISTVPRKFSGSLKVLKRKPGRINLALAGDATFTPPSTESVSEPGTPSTPASTDIKPEPFPLSPKPLWEGTPAPPPKPRAASTGSITIVTPGSSDRFIPGRSPGDTSIRNFRLNKPPQDLSPDERQSRLDGAMPDPFMARRITPTRHNTEFNSRRSSQNSQQRAVSAGGIWNVGGRIPQVNGPIFGVHNGRGLMVGSGTNAPIFASDFFEKETPVESNERFAGRLAMALDFDRDSRVFEFSHSATLQIAPGSSSTPKRKTVWKDGQWVSETGTNVLDAPSLRDDFYCTILAFDASSRVLAVGLRNRVYLWSETHGVRFPSRTEDNSRDTYVTSLSFSSQIGGRHILATGRSSGRVNLWCIDEVNDRIQHPLPRAIACVAFKPVPSRRYSERMGCIISTEELLIGDDVSDIYYYSIEWPPMEPDSPFQTSMILLAKLSVHTQQVCGIDWSLDGELFATGGNDNNCYLYAPQDILEARPSYSQHQQRSPLLNFPLMPSGPSTSISPYAPIFVPNVSSHYTLNPSPIKYSHLISPDLLPPASYSTHRVSSRLNPFPQNPVQQTITSVRPRHKWPHSAAVKAIAFCPWQRGLIATGGGSNDRAIHFFHTRSGACLATINVHAQVTSLVWSRTKREICATFGYAQPDHPYRIAVFSWPDCKQVVRIPWGGNMRALYAIAYPGGPNEALGKGKRKAGKKDADRAGQHGGGGGAGGRGANAGSNRRNQGRESEGGRWWSRTAEEGCIVVASSDESVKFHEVWSGSASGMGLGRNGGLGWSGILEDMEGLDWGFGGEEGGIR